MSHEKTDILTPFRESISLQSATCILIALIQFGPTKHQKKFEKNPGEAKLQSEHRWVALNFAEVVEIELGANWKLVPGQASGGRGEGAKVIEAHVQSPTKDKMEDPASSSLLSVSLLL